MHCGLADESQGSWVSVCKGKHTLLCEGTGDKNNIFPVRNMRGLYSSVVSDSGGRCLYVPSSSIPQWRKSPELLLAPLGKDARTSSVLHSRRRGTPKHPTPQPPQKVRTVMHKENPQKKKSSQLLRG